jgi:hypothetical protein
VGLEQGPVEIGFDRELFELGFDRELGGATAQLRVFGVDVNRVVGEPLSEFGTEPAGDARGALAHGLFPFPSSRIGFIAGNFTGRLRMLLGIRRSPFL